MSQKTRLCRRNSVHCSRAKVPTGLQRHLGRRQEQYALGTKDRRQAVHLVLEGSVNVDCRCRQLRERMRERQRPAAPTTLDDGAIQEICPPWRYHALWGDEEARQDDIYIPCGSGERAQERRTPRKLLRRALQNSRLDHIEPASRMFLRLLGVDLRDDGQRYRGRLHRFLQTVTEVHDRRMARDPREVVWSPGLPLSSRGQGWSQSASHLRLYGRLKHCQQFDPSRAKRTIEEIRRVA